MPTRFYIIAGEASGDLHGSNLIKALRQTNPDAVIRCWGGDLMEAAGATLVKHYRDLAFMGFWEVIKNLPTIIRNLRFCKQDILAFQPDVLVCIDYPGFNLRIAEWAHEKGFKIAYYISPQVWAWKEKRVITMKRIIDRMICILPFEPDYFLQKWNWKVDYVGHPLLSVMNRIQQQASPTTIHWMLPDGSTAPPQQPVIALLPGSRQQEIATLLPIMLSVTQHFKAYDFAVAMAPGISPSFYQALLKPYPNVRCVHNQTHTLLLASTAAVVTSGTATLETALLNVPEVVVYKGSPISYFIAKRLIDIRYISLVNLISNKEVVKELIQDQLTTLQLESALKQILNNPQHQQEMKKHYTELRAMLNTGEDASEKAANIIINLAKATN
ncbi:MAG: lipid-A-disaccharide synthase [Chitinophagia bacterium]|jgi:lipid-A-disaccharide synthase